MKKLLAFALVLTLLCVMPAPVLAGDFECDDVEVLWSELYIYLWNPWDGWVRVSLGWWPSGSICHDDDWLKPLPLPKGGQ